MTDTEIRAGLLKPLTDEDREWIDARADELFRESERARGGIRHATIVPQDFRDYFVVTATRERVLASIDTDKLRALVEAARKYVEQSCEGFCDDFSDDRYHPDMSIDCAGCELRAALAALQELGQ